MVWEVEIVGDAEDLRTLAESPDLSIVESGNRFLLRSSEFESLTDAGAVREKAREIVASISGAAKLFLGMQRVLAVGTVTQVDGERRNAFIFPESIVCHSRVGTPTLILTRPDGTVERSIPAAPVASALQKARQSPAVSKVLRLWNAPELQWIDLTRILEVIQGDGGPVKASERELDSLTGSAQHPAVAGDAARHGAPSWDPPPENKRITLREARELMDRIIRAWLASKN